MEAKKSYEYKREDFNNVFVHKYNLRYLASLESGKHIFKYNAKAKCYEFLAETLGNGVLDFKDQDDSLVRICENGNLERGQSFRSFYISVTHFHTNDCGLTICNNNYDQIENDHDDTLDDEYHYDIYYPDEYIFVSKDENLLKDKTFDELKKIFDVFHIGKYNTTHSRLQRIIIDGVCKNKNP
jgi:hypothetical protein